MKRVYFGVMTAFLLLVIGTVTTYADISDSEDRSEDNSEPVLVQGISSLHASQAEWSFSGMVTNESGERYPYFFQIQRNNTRFHALATLINGQSKAVLIYEESSTLIENPELTHWQVGNMFLRFNPINNTWVFGVKNKGKKGFNFKVDMFGLPEGQLSKKQNLREGIELLINQTGRLNGHMLTDETGKEEFVTAKKAWFRQVWVSKPQQVKHALTAVLCEFNDGSAFYSMSLPGSDSLRGSVAGWRNELGKSLTMSQFVTVTDDKEGGWLVHIPSPKITLSFPNLLNKINETDQLIAGMSSGAMPGFCAISHGDIDEQASP